MMLWIKTNTHTYLIDSYNLHTTMDGEVQLWVTRNNGKNSILAKNDLAVEIKEMLDYAVTNKLHFVGLSKVV